MALRHVIVLALVGITLGLAQTYSSPALADVATDAAKLSDRIMGPSSAPITVVEYASLTCTHCADFQNNTFAAFKEKFIDTGKVRFIFRDYPLDGIGLKVAAIARCMPESSFHPYISILYKSQKDWLASADPVKAAAQLAKLGGLNDTDAQACAASEKLMDAIVAVSTQAKEKYHVDATPSFVINDGAQVLTGEQSIANFDAAFALVKSAHRNY